MGVGELRALRLAAAAAAAVAAATDADTGHATEILRRVSDDVDLVELELDASPAARDRLACCCCWLLLLLTVPLSKQLRLEKAVSLLERFGFVVVVVVG